MKATEKFFKEANYEKDITVALEFRQAHQNATRQTLIKTI
jgi:hypothetical protein